MAYFLLNLVCEDTEGLYAYGYGNEIGAHCLGCPFLTFTEIEKAPDCFEPKNMVAVKRKETPICNCGADTKHGQRRRLRGLN